MILTQRFFCMQINKSFHQFCRRVDKDIWDRDFP